MRLIRIYLGVVFTVAGLSQWLGVQPWGRAGDWPIVLDAYVNAVRSHPIGWYHDLLVAHHGVVAITAPSLHVLIGVMFLVGLVPRLTAGIALALLVNYMALVGFWPWEPNPVAVLAALALTVVLATTVPLRFYIIVAFLWGTVGRLRNWSGWLVEVAGFLSVYKAFAVPLYRPVMSFALAHVRVFAWLVAMGEAAVSASLLFGATTPIGVIVGILLSLNYLLSKGNAPWSFNNDFAFIISFLAIAFAPAFSWRALARAWRSRRTSAVASLTPRSPASPVTPGSLGLSASPPSAPLPASPSASPPES